MSFFLAPRWHRKHAEKGKLENSRGEIGRLYHTHSVTTHFCNLILPHMLRHPKNAFHLIRKVARQGEHYSRAIKFHSATIPFLSSGNTDIPKAKRLSKNLFLIHHGFARSKENLVSWLEVATEMSLNYTLFQPLVCGLLQSSSPSPVSAHLNRTSRTRKPRAHESWTLYIETLSICCSRLNTAVFGTPIQKRASKKLRSL